MLTSRNAIVSVMLALSLFLIAGVALAAPPASPIDETGDPVLKPSQEIMSSGKAPGDPVDFAAALASGAAYLRHAQADVTEDNAGNGTDGVDETPDDPDDGGWDWSQMDPAFTHSTAASPKNIYGATAQGLYYAYLESGDPALLTAMIDAADVMIADPDIRSGGDMVFLMKLNSLPAVVGTTYQDAARTKYDGRITTYLSATGLAEYIRDGRSGQGYNNGIIAWDVGIYAVIASMLDGLYPGNGYDTDAVDVAEVLWQDSFNDNPGYFDIVDRQGFDPTYANFDYYWYTLGITGLIDAFNASGSHLAEIPGLMTIMEACQFSSGAFSYSYGANLDDEDWQSTAYSVLTLANLDQVTYQPEINVAAYWLAATQQAASGGWVYGSGNHYPEIGGECTAAVSFGLAASDAIVDDGFLSQADVDIYNAANGTDFVLGYNAFSTIQGAVDAVVGTTVTVLAGLYEEQVVISQDMTLQGAVPGTVTIVCPDLITELWDNKRAVVYVHDTDAVIVRDITVDGAGKGNTNNVLIGIGYDNAGGGIYDCTVTAVRHTPLNGTQGGLGIYLFNDDGTPRSMEVHGCDVNDFQKGGITTNAPDNVLSVDIRDNVITGAGVLTADNADPAQNGIQVWGVGINGTIENNTISGIAYDNTNASTFWVATSILDYYSSVNILNNIITQAHMGVYKYDATGQISGNDISIQKIGVYAWGVIASDPPRAIPSPVDDPTAKGRGPNKALLTVVADGNTVSFSGPDNTVTFGIEVDAGYGPDDIAFTATNNIVTGFEVGIEFYMCESACDVGVLTSGSANYNTFSGNTHGVRSNFDYITVDAACNWWDDISGPSALPINAGLGDAATGDLVFWPWLDAMGGNCTSYGDNNISATDPLECLTMTNTCVTVPVVFNRLDAAASRGVSVTFELSPELVLCTPNIYSDITIATGVGSWSEGYFNLNHQILDNGGGSYTVDRAILGSPCGPIVGGDVFFVQVARAAAVTTDAIGTLTVTNVLVRGCDNATLPGIPGAPASVTIDLTAPGVLADLAVAQVKTDNDDNGTTEITVSWTAPGGDADLIDIYRKGYGDYPEYDDGTGAVPMAPVTLANGWVHVATVDAATASYVDEPATRDFWYYAAYVTDACGSISDASAVAGGALNYHLGDVHDTSIPGSGDNLVDTSDISHLGFNYGVALGYGHSLNYLDVGPTTDYSVDALPTTDDRVQFEDLMMFAINYGQVSKDNIRLVPSGRNELSLEVMSLDDKLEVTINMAGDGTIQGLSVPLVWDGNLVEPMSMRPGNLINDQGGLGMVLSPEQGIVDAALFGVREMGVSGEGKLAVVTFRVKADGDPGIGLGEITARDSSNQEIFLTGDPGQNTPVVLPSASVLHRNVPNPFNPSTEFSFVLAHDGPVNLSVYSLQGRLIRTLVDESMAAGPHAMRWNGTDNNGRSMASGSYVVRMVAPDRIQSRHITLLK